MTKYLKINARVFTRQLWCRGAKTVSTLQRKQIPLYAKVIAEGFVRLNVFLVQMFGINVLTVTRFSAVFCGSVSVNRTYR